MSTAERNSFKNSYEYSCDFFFLQYVFKLTIMKTTFFLLDSALVCSPVFDEAIGNTSVVGRKDKLGAIVSLDSSQSFWTQA